MVVIATAAHEGTVLRLDEGRGGLNAPELHKPVGPQGRKAVSLATEAVGNARQKGGVLATEAVGTQRNGDVPPDEWD